MYTVSRFIIFVPIVIFILSLYLHYSAPNQSQTTVKPIPTVQPSQTSLTETFSKAASTGTKLNLKGPYQCQYTDKEVQINASIQNKKIYVQFTKQNKTSYMLVNGDCGYKWENGKNTGEKMCGIGTYLSLFESFSGMLPMDMSSMFSMMGTFAPSISIAPSQMSAVAESCKKESVDDSIFTIPTTIVFSDIQKVTPSSTQ